MAIKKKFLIISKNRESLFRFRKFLIDFLKEKFDLEIYYLDKDNNKFFFFSNIKKFISLLFHIINNKYDIILAVTVKPILFIGIIKKILNRKEITFGNFTGLGYFFINKNLFTKIVISFLKLSINSFNEIIVQNKEDKNLISIFYKKKISVLNGSGFDIKEFKRKVLKSKLILKKKKNLIYINFASRAIKNKGLNDLRIIIEKTKNPLIHFNVFILIDEKNLDKIEYSVLENIKKYRNVSYFQNKQEIEKSYFFADYLLFLSKREGCPRTILESFYYNKPVIAYSVPGVKGLVNKNNGYLFNYGDIPKILNLINNLNINQRKNFRKIEFQKTLKKYSSQNVLNDYKKIINVP